MTDLPPHEFAGLDGRLCGLWLGDGTADDPRRMCRLYADHKVHVLTAGQAERWFDHATTWEQAYNGQRQRAELAERRGDNWMRYCEAATKRADQAEAALAVAGSLACGYCCMSAAHCAGAEVKCCPDCTGSTHQWAARALRAEAEAAKWLTEMVDRDDALDAARTAATVWMQGGLGSQQMEAAMVARWREVHNLDGPPVGDGPAETPAAASESGCTCPPGSPLHFGRCLATPAALAHGVDPATPHDTAPWMTRLHNYRRDPMDATGRCQCGLAEDNDLHLRWRPTPTAEEQFAARRADEAFQERLRTRIAEDGPMLDRMAAGVDPATRPAEPAEHWDTEDMHGNPVCVCPELQADRDECVRESNARGARIAELMGECDQLRAEAAEANEEVKAHQRIVLAQRAVVQAAVAWTESRDPGRRCSKPLATLLAAVRAYQQRAGTPTDSGEATP